MMKTIEKFLNSGLYIFLIFSITFISWSFYKETPPHVFNLYNMIGVFLLILINTFILSFYKNTLYTIPIIIGFQFIINQSNMTFDSVGELGFPIVAFIVLLSGPIIHLIRFKPKFKRGVFFLGFALIAGAYILSFIFAPFEISGIVVSLMGLIYLLGYIFYSITLKGNLNYLFKIMLFANITLTLQVFFYIYQGYLLHPELDIYYRLFQGWGRNLGWANINDMCFYIALTFPSYLYFIFKKPQTYLTWFLMLLPVTAVILSKSRGGVIGFAVVVIGVVLFFVLRGNKKHLTHGLIFLTVSVIVFWINRAIFEIWYEFFLDSLGENLNDFSSNRIQIYKDGWEVFKSHPIFGAGWLSIQTLYPGERMFMYHQTFIHALATMGLFGLAALFVHYFQIIKYFFRNVSFEKYLFIIGYIASQVHGLIDNVQFSVPYSVLIVLFLVIFETSEKKTSFELINNRYFLIE
ncbi:MAG: hypothetical protein CVV57_07220 [Tenericutes bacterium HGW-Tenericutes-2]|nr:MAG: hypothetical protein CVV57_07220 [Tenericutes bacterium HGW-Tenericutes-2]